MAHIHEKIDFVVEVFIIYNNKVLLRFHDKYKIWLSVGGHIELDEDPNQAALREVKEEVGLNVKLYDGNLLFRYEEKHNRQLVPPIALGRHSITQTHEHVVSIYFAVADTDEVIPERESDQWKWVGIDELKDMELKPDILFYAKEALSRLSS